ncbi:MAG: hypothetical protein KF696_16055 [Planctomycetes bacterium]|nr:hypothetical protein [Planctomycetota bacterium]MCW8137248.1 hypothetical protein [Planctomycetota bacterium]
MKPVFRLAAAACVSAALLNLCFVSPRAESDEPALVTREYSARGLSTYEILPGTRTNSIRDVLAPDRALTATGDERPWDAWWMRDSGDEARCWEGLDTALEEIAEFVGIEDSVNVNVLSQSRFRMTGTEEAHKRMQWALQAMNDVSAARVNLAVYRVEGSFDSPIVPAAEVAARTRGARLVGTLAGGLGDPLVLQRTQHTSYVADIDMQLATEAAIAEPQLSTLNTGTEVVAGVLSLPDGSLWVQGWHAEMALNQLRKRTSSVGELELPDTSYRYAPVSAEIENGGGVLLDCGDGNRLLLVARCDRTVRDHEYTDADGTVYRLLNVAAALRGHGLADAWVMSPNSEQWLGDGRLPQVFFEPPVDGPYNDAAIMLCESINPDTLHMAVVGPYLGVRLRVLDADIDGDAPQQQHELAMINLHRAPHAGVAVRVSTFQLKDSTELPAGLLLGRPSGADVAQLGKPTSVRLMASRTGQAIDQIDLRMIAMLRDYSSVTATGVASSDPTVGTLALGSQLRWVATHADDGKLQIEMRAGVTVGPTEVERVDPKDPHSIERSKTSLTQIRVVDELAVGERMAAISPAAGLDGELVVIVLERLK